MLGQIRTSRMIATMEGAVDNALDLYQGEAVDLPFVVTDSAGAPVNLTSYTILWRMKAELDDASYVVSKVSTDAAEISKDTPTKGIGTVHLLTADWEDVDVGVYRHELWLTASSNDHLAIIASPCRVNEADAPSLA